MPRAPAFGLGVEDRPLVMADSAGQASIRDVIAFPLRAPNDAPH